MKLHLEEQLIMAATNGNLSFIQQILQYNPLPKYQNLCLFNSAAYGQIEIVRYILEQGADIHAEHDSALRCSAENGHLNIVQYLVEKGANIHAYNEHALNLSALYGHLPVVQYLVEQGADIHFYDDVALRDSAHNGQIKVVQYLIQQGANIQAGIQGAEENAQPEVLSWLEGYQLAQQEKVILIGKSEVETAPLIKNRL